MVIFSSPDDPTQKLWQEGSSNAHRINFQNALFDFSHICQNNTSSECKIEANFDLKYLFPGMCLTEKDKILTIEIYKFSKDEAS